MREKALSGMMSQWHRRDDDVKKRISQLKEEVAKLQLQHDSYTDATVEEIRQLQEQVSVYSASPLI